jgi:hypothetical protein
MHEKIEFSCLVEGQERQVAPLSQVRQEVRQATQVGLALL